MKRYVLDTDMLTLYQLGHPGVVRQVLHHLLDELAVAVVTVEEQLTGWYTRLRRAKQRDELARIYQRLTDTIEFLAQVKVLSFTEPAIERYEQLKAAKLNIGKNDLRIAAIALERGATLVTRNTRDFRRIPGLGLEDWSV
jgi:tRNA(fMet)-specific endonuclease VapC